ncbi:MAG TPA: SIMPL domain-containing protein [Candidatus Binatia bacterium]|nr:SIMPL domain-containing protein [Candidatus Binatia bacterium]
MPDSTGLPANLPTITVTGFGRVSVRPDTADLRLGVSLMESTVEAARAAAARTLAEVLARLRALGIEDRDLQTSIVAVNPQYDYSRDGQPPRLAGYSITNLVAVVIRNIDQVGEAIDAALTAGATSVDRLSFRVADPSAAEAEARAAAIADARVRAEAYAKAAGVSIAGVAAILEAGAPIPFPMPFQEMKLAAARDAATPVEAGENEIRATVTVAFRIE